jgi:hypothetical protein
MIKLKSNLMQPMRLWRRRRRRVKILKLKKMMRKTMKDRIKTKIRRRKRRMEDFLKPRNQLKIRAHQLIMKILSKMLMNQHILKLTWSLRSTRNRKRLNLPSQRIMSKLQSHLLQS